jgi:3-oxoadipate enol-lactonase
MPRILVGAVELYYERSGSGPRLLLISGTGGDLRQRPSITDSPLSANFEVLAYDQRGLGQSSIPQGPYSMADYADDAAHLLSAVGWDDALVLGISFGGMVAQELALRHRKRVRKLVLACTSSGGEGGSSFPLHELSDEDGDENVARLLELADTRFDKAWREENPDDCAGLLNVLAARAEVGKGEPRRVEGHALQLDARRRHNTWGRLDQITCPTLVAAGRYDGIAPPDNSERLASAIPDAQLRVFDGGHLFLLQDPTAFPAIIEFLAA